jgi:hypothetical protein
MKLPVQPGSRESKTHLVLSFFRDQLLKMIYDCVPPRHHRLDLRLVKVALGSLLKVVSTTADVAVLQVPTRRTAACFSTRSNRGISHPTPQHLLPQSRDEIAAPR